MVTQVESEFKHTTKYQIPNFLALKEQKIFFNKRGVIFQLIGQYQIKKGERKHVWYLTSPYEQDKGFSIQIRAYKNVEYEIEKFQNEGLINPTILFDPKLQDPKTERKYGKLLEIENTQHSTPKTHTQLEQLILCSSP